MKQSGTTIIFVIVCIGVLIAAYVLGICIRGIRFSGVENQSDAVAVSEKADTESQAERVEAQPAPGPAAGAPRGFFPEQRFGTEQDRAGMGERFENMTEEERQQARAAMRDRFGGRRREGGPQLSEEDRNKMREEIEELRGRWEEMSEEEREEVRAQMFEKYGFFPRIGAGGNRGPGGFGGTDGSRRRPGGRPGDR